MADKRLPKEVADRVVESISEDPRIEPGQADTTPGTETPKDKKQKPQSSDSSTPVTEDPQ